MKYFSHAKIAFNKILDKAVGPLEMAILGIIVISTLSYALAWQTPGGNPPASNTDAPLNTGSTGQAKSGGLILNSGGAPTGLIVQNGNVGIGTINPGRPLDIATGPDTPQLGLINTGAGGRRWNIYSQQGGNFHIWEDGAPITRLFINGSNGNVGIGETNPSQKLDVAGYVRGQLGLCIGGDCRSTWADTSGPLVYRCPVFNEGCPGTCANNLSLSPTCVRGSSSDAFCRAWGGATEACAPVGRLVAP